MKVVGRGTWGKIQAVHIEGVARLDDAAAVGIDRVAVGVLESDPGGKRAVEEPDRT
jgi:hypothetical protein